MSVYISLLQLHTRPMSIHVTQLQSSIGVMSIDVRRLQTDKALMSIDTRPVQTHMGALQACNGRLWIYTTSMEVDILRMQRAVVHTASHGSDRFYLLVTHTVTRSARRFGGTLISFVSTIRNFKSRISHFKSAISHFKPAISHFKSVIRHFKAVISLFHEAVQSVDSTLRPGRSLISTIYHGFKA